MTGMNIYVIIAIVSIILIAVILFFVLKSSKHNNHDDIDIKIKKGVVAANINTNNSLDVKTDVIFDSTDKINKNFNFLIETYLPLIDINLINSKLRENGAPDAQTIINNNNVNVMDYILNDVINNLGLLIYSDYNKINFILIGLLINLLLNIMVIKNTTNIISSKIYYLGDNNDNDFILYIIPNSFKGDKQTLINDNNIKQISIFTYSELSDGKIYKCSLYTNLKEFVYMIYKGITLKSVVTDGDIDLFKQTFKNNKNNLIKFITYLIVGRLLTVQLQGNITNNSLIITDIVNVNNSLTQSFIDTYSSMIISRDANDLTDELRETYNNFYNTLNISTNS